MALDLLICSDSHFDMSVAASNTHAHNERHLKLLRATHATESLNAGPVTQTSFAAAHFGTVPTPHP